MKKASKIKQFFKKNYKKRFPKNKQLVPCVLGRIFFAGTGIFKER